MANHNEVPSTEKPAKRASVSLTSGEGAAQQRLTIMAKRTRGNRGETVVTITDAKRKAQRGMTAKYDTFELAVEAMHKVAQDAAKKGWKRVERSGGFKPRPDAFSTIPAPGKVSK